MTLWAAVFTHNRIVLESDVTASSSIQAIGGRAEFVQLSKGSFLDLPDSFARKFHICADFREGLGVFAVKSKTPFDDDPFFFVELIQQSVELFIEGLPNERRHQWE